MTGMPAKGRMRNPPENGDKKGGDGDETAAAGGNPTVFRDPALGKNIDFSG